MSFLVHGRFFRVGATPFRSLLALSVWALAASSLAMAQGGGDPVENSRSSKVPTFSSQVKVVNVLATVRDKHGHILNDLSQTDFALDEDGRPQAIKYFARDTELPLKLGLLVDTSGSVQSVLEEERAASRGFLNEMLRVDRDSAFVIHFDRQVELLQDVTQSSEKLESAVDQIAPSEPDRGNGGWGGGGRRGGRGGFHGGGTLLYDAVYLAADELMQKQQGRKALILLTDGEDQGSKTSLGEAIEFAQRADTLVYCIYFKGEGFGQFGPMGPGRGGWGRGGTVRFPVEHENGKKVLQRIARETGARMFEVSKKESIGQIYAEIQEELRNQYSLGYTPDRTASGASYHKIHLTAKRQDGVVQTRDGYYD